MKIIAPSAAALLALSGTALAADLPSHKGPLVAPIVPIFSWTGIYAGVNAGGVFSGSTVGTSGTAPFTVANVLADRRPPFISKNDTGFIGGGQIGYNYQNGQYLMGLEADIQYVDVSTSFSRVGTSGANSVFRKKLDYLGTARMRFGYAFDRWLPYATGGLAYGNATNTATFFSAATAGQIDYFGSRSETYLGYALGAGMEYAVTNNISLKAEYLYYNLGGRNVAVDQRNFTLTTGSYISRFSNDGHIARAGLNYRFTAF